MKNVKKIMTLVLASMLALTPGMPGMVANAKVPVSDVGGMVTIGNKGYSLNYLAQTLSKEQIAEVNEDLNGPLSANLYFKLNDNDKWSCLFDINNKIDDTTLEKRVGNDITVVDVLQRKNVKIIDDDSENTSWDIDPYDKYPGKIVCIQIHSSADGKEIGYSDNVTCNITGGQPISAESFTCPSPFYRKINNDASIPEDAKLPQSSYEFNPYLDKIYTNFAKLILKDAPNAMGDKPEQLGVFPYSLDVKHSYIGVCKGFYNSGSIEMVMRRFNNEEDEKVSDNYENIAWDNIVGYFPKKQNTIDLYKKSKEFLSIDDDISLDKAEGSIKELIGAFLGQAYENPVMGFIRQTRFGANDDNYVTTKTAKIGNITITETHFPGNGSNQNANVLYYISF